jgi:hypothetical protein
MVIVLLESARRIGAGTSIDGGAGRNVAGRRLSRDEA